MMGRGTAAAAAVFCLFVSLGAHALDIKIVENQMILSGPIETGDGWTFNRAVSNNPKVDTLVFRNMPGGKIEEMDRMASTILERKLNTVVSGRCMSACAHIFLAGETRRFADDFPSHYAHLGFHGGYRSEGSLKGWGGQPASNAYVWYVNRTSGKLDPELVKRWLTLEQSSGLAIFYYNSPDKIRSSPSYFCVRSMPIEQCEKIGKSALDFGLITTAELAPVKDTPYWKLDQYKKVAPISSVLDGKTFDDSKKKEVEDYARKTGTKALVLSENGKWIVGTAHSDGHVLAIVSAVSSCEAKVRTANSRTRCHVIAIDNDLTITADAIQAKKFD
jgi:hypothetical protein